jgi:molecular chaperone HscA
MELDRDLLSAEEDAAIHAAMTALAQAEQGSDSDQIRNATEALIRATDAFAARRMNRSIQRALAGQSVERFVSQSATQTSSKP